MTTGNCAGCGRVFPEARDRCMYCGGQRATDRTSGAQQENAQGASAAQLKQTELVPGLSLAFARERRGKAKNLLWVGGIALAMLLAPLILLDDDWGGGIGLFFAAMASAPGICAVSVAYAYSDRHMLAIEMALKEAPVLRVVTLALCVAITGTSLYVIYRFGLIYLLPMRRAGGLIGVVRNIVLLVYALVASGHFGSLAVRLLRRRD